MLRLLLAMILCWVPGAFAASEVYVVPIHGEISDSQYAFIRRGLKEAEEAGAKAVIFDMDTLGGSLDATEKIQRAIMKSGNRTITWINPNAASAGALLAISTQEIYMAPASAVGAAAPVAANGENLPQTIMGKKVSYYSSYFSGVAEKNGHDPQVARAFIDEEAEVKIGDEVIHPKGAVLSLSAREAVRRYGGKPLFAVGLADSLDALLQQAGLAGAVVVPVQPTGFERAAFWITALAPLLLLGGIVGAWIEIKTPGFGLPGITSAVCFTIFFAGHYIAGLAGWETPVLFGLGVVLIVVELMFFPGVLVVGGLGVLLVVSMLIWAMVDHYPGQPVFSAAAELFALPLLNFFIAVVIAAILMAILARYLPRTALYRKIVLGSQHPAGPAFVPERNEFSGLEAGAQGVAASILRPSGRATFEGKPRDVITTGAFVEAGTRIRVVAVEGSRIIVEPLPGGSGDEGTAKRV